MPSTRGVLQVLSAPSPLCPHVEWAIGGAFGTPVSLEWHPQPAERATYRAEWAWTGPVGSATRLASALRRWPRLRFEVTEHATADSEGERYSYTPGLGIFHATMGLHGDILVPEDRLKHAVAGEALGGEPLLKALERLLGVPWDDELDVFRHAGEDAPVRWLHQVV